MEDRLLADIYNEHGKGTAENLPAVIVNGLREHIDRVAEICKVVYSLKPKSLLDAPCATGLITTLVKWYLDGPTRVLGIDISEAYCNIAKHTFGLDVVCTDMLSWNTDEQFDVVMCLEMLEHVPNPQDYVTKAASLSSKWVLLSIPLEAMPVDGVIHVDKIHPTALWDWAINAGLQVERMWVLPSAFCEKPKWLGWIFLLGEKQ